MSLIKTLGRSSPVQGAAAGLAAGYLRLVRATTAYTVEPDDLSQRALADAPVIAALWHGQHTMAHFAWPPGMKVGALISRNADAEINARLLQRLGVIPVRGSGGAGGDKIRKRGGVEALRDMLRLLDDGVSLVMTADVPKVARVAGRGVVTLARLSGRPIYPLAVVNARRMDFRSWDRASIGLPFTRGAIVAGTPIRVSSDADEMAVEAARQQVQTALDLVHAHAYARVGSADPGMCADRGHGIVTPSPHRSGKERR